MIRSNAIPWVVAAERLASSRRGVYESLIDPAADYAAIDANLLSVITDDGEPVAGCDLTPEDFEHCDKSFYREILEGVIAEREENRSTFTASS